MLIGLDERMDGIEDDHQGAPHGGARGHPKNGFHSITQECFELSTSNLAC